MRFSDGSSVKFPSSEERRTASVIDGFQKFLVDKSHSYISLEGFDVQLNQYVKKQVPIVYSCDEEYKDRRLAGLYKLEKWYQQLPPHRRYVSMLTLTTYQKEWICYEEQYQFIVDSWLKLKDIMKKDIGKFQYIVIGEPHHSGFLHLHILIFRYIREDLQEKYKRVWNEKYQAGSYRNGVKIDGSNKGCLRSAKNYLMKYVSKTMTMHQYDERISGSDLVRFDESSQNWNRDVHFLVYQAILWNMNKHNGEYKGVRTFQPSRELESFMKLDYVPNEDIVWYRISYVIWGESHVIHEFERPVLKFPGYLS